MALVNSSSALSSSSLNDDLVPILEETSQDDNMTKIGVQLEIIVYSIFFLIGCPANVRVLLILIRRKLYLKSRHHKLLTNLAVADAIVCMIQIPTEIAWRLTGDWRGGNIGCKVFAIFRVFGLYASSMILIVISIDRYYAVSHPFEYSTMGDRIDLFLLMAWLASAALSLAQAFIFRTEPNPEDAMRPQCVGFHAFPEKWMQSAYSLLSLIVFYWLPLLAIIICYSAVYVRSIYQQKKSAAIKNQQVTIRSNANASTADIKADDTTMTSVNKTTVMLAAVSSSESNLRCDTLAPHVSPQQQQQPAAAAAAASSAAPPSIAPTASTVDLNSKVSHVKSIKPQRDMKKKILQQTLIIVMTFIACWTPYVIMTTWYQIDFASAFRANPLVQSIFFLFAVSNSIINPFIYGKFVKDNPQRV